MKMRGFSKKYRTYDDEGKGKWVTYEEQLQELWEKFPKEGASCTVILPEKEMTNEDPLVRAAATGILGFQGFALTGGRVQNKSFSGTMRPATKGLVLAEREPYGQIEMKIPWTSITNIIKVQDDFKLKLIDSTSIYIKFDKFLKQFEEYRNNVIDHINSKACGVVEDGWD